MERNAKRIWFHLDANSAFLSWSASYRVNVLGEELDLRQIPSVVGGDEEKRHGIVLAKSIPAKKYGIHTGESLMEARRKCPGLTVIPPDYHLYVTASRAFVEKLREYSDHVLQYSIDEAWMEYTGLEGLWGDPVVFAHQLKKEIREELGFTVNIGISSNQLLSKMAGGFCKPDRVHTLFPEEVPGKLWPLPVSRLFWVGPATEKKLKRMGIFTIGELANADPSMIRAFLKKPGEIIQGYANGRELEQYVYERQEAKGYGNSLTAPSDVTDIHYAGQILLSLCETVGMRLREDGVKISCVEVHLVTTGFEHFGKQEMLLSPTDVTEEIYERAYRLYQRLWDKKTPVRQIGVHTSRVERAGARQYNLFDGQRFDQLEKWDRAVDAIRKKYGEDAVQRASFLKEGHGLTHMGGGLDRERRTGITVGIDLAKENMEAAGEL